MKEFREFAVKGNMVDLAVGVIIGAAFGKIVTSVVEDLVMPPLGKLMGNVNFTDMFVTLDGQTYASRDAAKAAGAPAIYYGAFITVLIQFLIVAFAVFLMVKAINAVRSRLEKEAAEAEAVAEPAADVVLLTEIRDLLKARG